MDWSALGRGSDPAEKDCALLERDCALLENCCHCHKTSQDRAPRGRAAATLVATRHSVLEKDLPVLLGREGGGGTWAPMGGVPIQLTKRIIAPYNNDCKKDYSIIMVMTTTL